MRKRGSFWQSTVGNTFLSLFDNRPKEASDWDGFKNALLASGVPGELKQELEDVDVWNAAAVEHIGKELARIAGNVWYK